MSTKSENLELVKKLEKELLDKIGSFKKDGILIPDDDFYSGGIYGMLGDILNWLDINKERPGFLFSEIDSPGIFIKKDGKRFIIINPAYKEDSFAIGAILAHECAHCFLTLYPLGKKI